MKIVIRNVAVPVPIIPVSALVFYAFILVLWRFSILPSPVEIFEKLEGLYQQNGLVGLFTAAVLEGLVYVGLYFPGSSIILLSVILSTGSVTSLLTISLVVALALTLTSMANYFLGRRLSVDPAKFANQHKGKFNSRGLLLSALHPNALAFYFFNAGFQRKTIKELVYVPIIMVPYGFILGLVFFSLKTPIKNAIEAPGKVIVILIIWLVVSILYEYRKAHKTTKH